MSKIGMVATGTLAGLIAFVVASVLFLGQVVGPFYLNAVTVMVGVFVLTMGWMVATYSARNLRGQHRQGRYAALLALAIGSLWLAVTADPVALTATGWTVSGLAVAGLVAHADTLSARSAARRVAVRLLVGDVAVWAAVALMYAQGVSDRSELSGAGWIVPALLAVGGLIRSALVPAWRWLPLTAEAPSPVSALLHAGVVNGIGLLAVLWWPLFEAAPGVLLALLVVGGITAVLGTAAMRVRPDVKGKLASSTSAQMGYMTVQLGLGLPAFALLHLIGHGFYKAWLFLRAGGASRRPSAPLLTGIRPAGVLGLALTAVAFTALGVLTWASAPVVDLVPLAVATVTATFALAALVWPDRATAAWSTVRARSWSGIAVLAGLFVYVVTLGVWSQLFELPGVWSGTNAAVLTVVVIAVGALGMVAVAKGWLRKIVEPLVVDTAVRVRGSVTPVTDVGSPDVTVAVDAATRTVGAMWPIHSAVAVNPLSGLQDLSFDDAAEIAGRTWQARSHLTDAQYAHALSEGRFTLADLVAAAGGLDLPAEIVADYLCRRADWRPTGSSLFSAEQLLDELTDDELALAMPRSGAAPHTLGEQAGIADKVSGLANAWTSLANADLPGAGHLWASFRSRVQDLGLRGLSTAVRALPDEPTAAVSALLHTVVPPAQQVGYLSRLLARDPGWAAHLKQRDPRLLADLLAIRATFDVFASAAAGAHVWAPAARVSDRDAAIAEVAPIVDLLYPADARQAVALARILSESARLTIWQRAWEQRYRNRLIDRVSVRAAQPVAHTTPDAQVIMCIDVRSERFRRHLEALGPYETHGFAGFFGVAIRHEAASGATSDQCPVLLKPSFLITENDQVPVGRDGAAQAIRGGLVTSTARPASAFAVAEGLGVLAGLDALVQTAVPRTWGRWRDRLQPSRRGELHIGQRQIAGVDDDLQWGMSVEQRTTAAAGMLRALGIVDSFAPVILITGHAAKVENNAFAAAYDCGACGGNGGHVNARVMAAVVNDPRVRRQLAEVHGITVPDSTAAVPAWHNTTTDAVTIDAADVPASHRAKVAELQAHLTAAQTGCLRERMAELPGVSGTDAVAADRRSADWAEPQPEWGLAGNAAFVIGPRSMTKGLNLRGRVFLHSYEPGLDVDGSTLELLLTAPMVVTQWINNQYYFATVDPQRFGAGDKTTHNVVGDFGVFSGAGGDLRVGLPWQGVYRSQPGEAATLMHEPLRLQVVVYADPDDIVGVLDAHPEVAALVANEWIALAAIDPATGNAFALGTDMQWRDWLGETADEITAIDGVMSREG